MLSKILIAVQNEHDANLAESFIARLESRTAEIMLKVLHVVEPIEAISEWPSEQYRIAAHELVTGLCVRLRSNFPNASVENKVAEGYANEVIIDEALGWGATLIMVGTRCRRGKVLPGSVSSEVVSHSTCPVVVLHQTAILR